MSIPDDRRNIIRNMVGEVLQYFTGQVPRKGDRISMDLAHAGDELRLYDVVYVEWDIGEDSRAIVFVDKRKV
jgi:hypothetical protein